MTAQDLEKLLQEMSLEEKVGQMVQLSPAVYGKDSVITGPAGEVALTEEKTALIGSLLGTGDPEVIRRIQKEAVARQPHHIPMLFMLDVINGDQTIFPINLALGCSFDPDMAERTASIAAREASAAGVHVTFAPMLDLVRDARWGRVMESPGEDPTLNARIGEALVHGFQGENVGEPGRVAACLKHFAGYGAPEGGREYDNVELSEQTFRNDYLTAYQAAVDAGCRMAMTSFNTLNRVPSSANRVLCRQILRGEMGFDGVLISDYAAVEELISHGIAADRREAAKLAVEAGVDIDMMTTCYLDNLPDLVRSGEVPEALVDEAVRRILRLKNDLGLFENPYKDADAAAVQNVWCCDAFRKEARASAPETFVLLKNKENLLPLDADTGDGSGGGEKILFAGPYLDSHALYGSWSFPNHPEEIPTLRERLEQRGDGRFLYARGCGMLPDKTVLTDHPLPDLTPAQNVEAVDAACRLAAEADRVVLFLGEHIRQTGEGASRTSLRLPEPQMELLRRVSAVNRNTIAVLFTGRPLVLREVEQLAGAVLCVWRPGTEGAQAILDVLFGETEPSGRLSMSFPRAEGQEPLYYSRFQGGRPRFSASDPKAYRIGYIDEDYWAYHAFGAGEGYTRFSYSPVSLSAAKLCWADPDRAGTDASGAAAQITAAVTLTNTGRRRGTEIVQMYLRDRTGSVVRPVRELKGFRRVTLDPGESREISFVIAEPMLRFIRLDGTFGSEPGLFDVYIGHDSTTDNSAAFALV